MARTADILMCLDIVANETTRMLQILDDGAWPSDADRREAKRRVLEIRGKSHELFEWLSGARLEEPRN